VNIQDGVEMMWIFISIIIVMVILWFGFFKLLKWLGVL